MVRFPVVFCHTGAICPDRCSTHFGWAPHLLSLLATPDLSRRIPSTLTNLVSLRHLKLNNNSIRGTIPSELGALGELRHLRLHDSLLTGRVPESLAELPFLETLSINSTLVSGRIPPRLCRIENLQFTCSRQLCGCNTCLCPSLRI
jgi:hypothetical protein